MTDRPAIEATGLAKTYGSTTVLGGVDLRVAPGSVFSFPAVRPARRGRRAGGRPAGEDGRQRVTVPAGEDGRNRLTR